MLKKIFQVLCLLIAFFLPVYGKVLPPLIGLLIFVWLLEGKFREKGENLRKNLKLLLISPVIFYLLHLVGLLYTENTSFGWFDLEVKLSLIIFPVIFATTGDDHFTRKFYDRIFLSFILGCIITIFLFSIRAEINFLKENDFQYLYYIYLGWYFHPSYLSMYFVFGIVIMANFLLRDHEKMNVWLKTAIIITMLMFQYFVFMLSSKAGITSMFIILLVFIILWYFRSKKLMQSIGLVIVLTGFFVLLDRVFPLALERMEEAGQAATSTSVPANADGSSSSRLNTWKTDLSVIADNMPFGVGTGDVKDELMARFKANGNTYAIERKLNAHSQYLQALVVIGIPGFIALLVMIFWPGYLAVRKSDIIITGFIFLISFNMLVESVLETQAGVIFFAFYMTLFLREMTSENFA